MKVGDLVKRKAKSNLHQVWCIQQNEINGPGLILKIENGNNLKNSTKILTLYYAKSGRISTLAESIVEIVSPGVSP
tara:strand:+ start:832 stop:1059 length:228 start_codon:yes stop_codon:yes gene_type:complete